MIWKFDGIDQTEPVTESINENYDTVYYRNRDGLYQKVDDPYFRIDSTYIPYSYYKYLKKINKQFDQ